MLEDLKEKRMLIRQREKGKACQVEGKACAKALRGQERVKEGTMQLD